MTAGVRMTNYKQGCQRVGWGLCGSDSVPLPTVCKYTSANTQYKCTNTQIHKYTNAQIHKYTNTGVCAASSVPLPTICKYTNADSSTRLNRQIQKQRQCDATSKGRQGLVICIPASQLPTDHCFLNLPWWWRWWKWKWCLNFYSFFFCTVEHFQRQRAWP